MSEQIVANLSALLPSLVASVIALVVSWRFLLKFKREGNSRKVGGMIVVFVGPIREELLFRLPVLLLAGVFSTNTYVILVSSVLFGLIHFKHSPLTNEKNLVRLQEKYPQLDLGKRFQLITRLVTTVITGLLGVGLAHIALKSGSLVAPILCHMVWNAVAPTVIVLLILLGVVLFGTVYKRLRAS